MGYYMRFYDTDARPLRLDDIRQALREIDTNFDIDGGFLLYSGEWHAEISIDAPGADYFDSDMRMLQSGLVAVDDPMRSYVEGVLRDAQREICLRILFGDRDLETTFSRLDVLWDWLFAHRSGLLHAEGEGFYQDETLILALK